MAVSKYLHQYTRDELTFSMGLYNSAKIDFYDMGVSYDYIDDGDDETPHEVERITFSRSSDFQRLIGIMTSDVKSYHYCPMCDTENSFSCKVRHPFKVTTEMFYVEVAFNDLHCDGDERIEIIESTRNKAISKTGRDIKVFFQESDDHHIHFHIELTCAHNDAHKFTFYYAIIKPPIGKTEYELTKVGQYPSIADFQKGEIKKYRKILSKLGFDKEYTRALRLFSFGVGIGSFVYLRRILEDLIQRAYVKALSDGRITKEEFEFIRYTDNNGIERSRRRRVNEKIDLLKGFLPDLLVEKSSLYGIVSKGIHELSEEECMKYFPVIRSGIEIILKQMHEKEEAEALEKSFKAEIDQLVTKANK